MPRGKQPAFRGGCTSCDEYESMVRATCGVMSPAAYRELMATCPGMTAGQLDAAVRDFEHETTLLSLECRATFANLPFLPAKLSGGADAVPVPATSKAPEPATSKAPEPATSKAPAPATGKAPVQVAPRGPNSDDDTDDWVSDSEWDTDSRDDSRDDGEWTSDDDEWSDSDRGARGRETRSDSESIDFSEESTDRGTDLSTDQDSASGSSSYSDTGSSTDDSTDYSADSDVDGKRDVTGRQHGERGRGDRRDPGPRPRDEPVRARTSEINVRREKHGQEGQRGQETRAATARALESARATYIVPKDAKTGEVIVVPAAPDWARECPADYSAERKCVVDPVTAECIPEREIAGDKTGAQFSDGHCYSGTHLQMHARAQHAAGAKSLTLPTGRPYTRADLEKLDKTRLATYCHQTMLHSIMDAVVTRVDTAGRQQGETFESFLEHLRAEKVPQADENGVWAMFKSGLSAVASVTAAVMSKLVDVTKWLASKAVSLGSFVASNPRMARFFLIMVKEMVNMFCQKMAIAWGKARYKYKGMWDRVSETATGEVAQMAAEGMVASVLSGPGLKNLASGLFGAVKAMAKDIPILGSVVKGAEAFADVVGGPAQEAMKFAAELAIYKQDMNKSFESVLDLLQMVVNPVKCMEANAEVDTWDQKLDGKAVDRAQALSGGAIMPNYRVRRRRAWNAL